MIGPSRIDHLVIAASSLQQGVLWCEATLGVTPGPGGNHPLMGTHNRLLKIATPDYPRAYLEIIAIDPSAPDPGRRRWFDLDDPALQQAVAREPRLVHFIASTGDARPAIDALKQLGIDRGPLLQASRATAHGLLTWGMSVRDDGQRLFQGALPTLIAWDGAHPADTMPDCGLALNSMRACHPQAAELLAAHAAIGLQGVSARPGAANLVATLETPRGLVTLASAGI